MTQREALKLALEALKQIDAAMPFPVAKSVIRKAEEALAQKEQEPLTGGDQRKHIICLCPDCTKPAQPEQQPVAHSVVEPLRHDEYQRRVSVKWVNQPVAGPLYTTPPQRKELEATERQVEMLSDGLSKCSKALRLALETFEELLLAPQDVAKEAPPAITAIKEVLAQPEQEPCKTCGGTGEVETGIGMMVCDECHGTTYTTPPQRTWVGLTDKEVREAMNSWSYSQRAMTHAEWVYAVQRATEAKLKQKNT